MREKGLYFEEIDIGREWETDGRTVTETDIVNFAAFSGDWMYLHTDDVMASQGPFGGRIAHGLLGLSIAMGLMVRLGILDGTAEAFLGLEWSFTGPIRIGDTIKNKITVIEKKVSKKGKGIVGFAFRMENQRGEVVQRGTKTIMIKSRGEGSEK